MLNYYDEIKEAVIEVLEEEEEVKNILQSENSKDTIVANLVDYLFDWDSITGNASCSYYCSSYKSRKHCYYYFRDVFEALEAYGYTRDLELFKIFVSLVEEGYVDVDTMKIKDDIFYEEEKKYLLDIVNNAEEIKELDFEKLDVITRCYMLSSVLNDVVNNYLD